MGRIGQLWAGPMQRRGKLKGWRLGAFSMKNQTAGRGRQGWPSPFLRSHSQISLDRTRYFLTTSTRAHQPPGEIILETGRRAGVFTAHKILTTFRILIRWFRHFRH